MKAMILKSIVDLGINPEPLELHEVPKPVATGNKVLIKVEACGVCHTELDEIEGRTPPKSFPLIPGHQVVGIVESIGPDVKKLKAGHRVGVAWISSSCGKCVWCRSGRENLCSEFVATGRDTDGGYAEYMTVDEDFTYSIPGIFTSIQAAPLLCAGAVGYRSLVLSGLVNGGSLGLTGFGASAHIVLQLTRNRFPDTKIFVFARSEKERSFARELGAFWAGGPEDALPELLDCIIDTTPVWKPVMDALNNLKPGGRLVINAIRKEESDKSQLLNIDFHKHLWMEKEIKSVANVTRRDVNDFLLQAAVIPIIPEVQEYKLEDTNKALLEMKKGIIRGAKVLVFK
jgi:propanol-preferring alcohol dehydrogenase